LPEIEADPNDLRLATGLDPQKHYAQQKQITVVDGKQQFVLGDITSSKFEAYDSLGRVYSLYVTLSGDATLVEFGFLTGWPDLKPEEKRAKYSKYACHELSFFLYKKDPDFFRTVVLPYLKNKKDKQFLDHWLLGDKLRHVVGRCQFGVAIVFVALCSRRAGWGFGNDDSLLVERSEKVQDTHHRFDVRGRQLLARRHEVGFDDHLARSDRLTYFLLHGSQGLQHIASTVISLDQGHLRQFLRIILRSGTSLW